MDVAVPRVTSMRVDFVLDDTAVAGPMLSGATGLDGAIKVGRSIIPRRCIDFSSYSGWLRV